MTTDTPTTQTERPSTSTYLAKLLAGPIFPWAGATAATAFAAGEVDLKPMIRIGVITTAIFILIVATIHIVMAPFV